MPGLKSSLTAVGASLPLTCDECKDLFLKKLAALAECDQSVGVAYNNPTHKDEERSAETSDSVTSRCPYPDVLRSNPRCEAPGTMFQPLVTPTGQGLGGDGQDERK